MIFPSNGRDVAETLQRFTKTVRERYIVEFPPPFNSTAGRHCLLVTLDKMDWFIRAAGVTGSMAEPALVASPTTGPAEPCRTRVSWTTGVSSSPQARSADTGM